jgi:hypothetical protein
MIPLQTCSLLLLLLLDAKAKRSAAASPTSADRVEPAAVATRPPPDLSSLPNYRHPWDYREGSFAGDGGGGKEAGSKAAVAEIGIDKVGVGRGCKRKGRLGSLGCKLLLLLLGKGKGQERARWAAAGVDRGCELESKRKR